MTDLAKAVFAYEDMLEEQAIDLKSFPCSDVNIPIELLHPERRTEEFLAQIYKECVQQKRPWQEVITLDFKYEEGCIY